MRHLRLLGHQHDVALPPHRFGQRFVFYRITWRPKEGVKHHKSTIVIGQPVKQLGMQRTIPRLSACLVELIERFIVHRDKNDVVCDGTRAEEEQIIVAGIYPGFAQRRFPQYQTTKHHQRRAQRGFNKILSPDDFDHDSPGLWLKYGED